MSATNDDLGTVVGANNLILHGVGADLAIASNAITVTDHQHVVSGSGTLHTISVSGGNPDDGAKLVLIPAAGSTWTVQASGGNIAGTAPSVVAGQPIYCEWNGTNWYLSASAIAAAQVVSGQLALARGGTAADLSATGGTGRVLKQASAGAAITVATFASSELSDATTAAGTIGLATGLFQRFELIIFNNAGTLQHTVRAMFSDATAPNFAAKITGASSTLTNMPLLTSVQDFVAGGGADNAVKSEFHFNTAAQTVADLAVMVAMSYNDTGTMVLAEARPLSLNVNGTTRVRLAVKFRNGTSGAAFDLTTANIGASKSIAVQLFGYIK